MLRGTALDPAAFGRKLASLGWSGQNKESLLVKSLLLGSYVSTQKHDTVNLIFTDGQNLAKSIFRAKVKQMASTFPPLFHKAMIPDLRSPDDDCHADAEQKPWRNMSLATGSPRLTCSDAS